MVKQRMQEQKRMRELQEREEQKALFTEKIAHQMYEAEVGVSYCNIITFLFIYN